MRTRKTTGSSTRTAMLPYVTDGYTIRNRPRRRNIKETFCNGSSFKARTKLSQHNRPERILKAVGSNAYESYFKFVFVRNPWDVLVSRYFWVRYKRARAGIADSQEFEEWLPSYLGLPVSERVDQWKYASIGGAEAADYIGRYESLFEDLRTIFSKLGIEELPVLGNEKGGIRPKIYYQEFYTSNLRRMVAVRYAQSIRNFDYSF